MFVSDPFTFTGDNLKYDDVEDEFKRDVTNRKLTINIIEYSISNRHCEKSWLEHVYCIQNLVEMMMRKTTMMMRTKKMMRKKNWRSS